MKLSLSSIVVSSFIHGGIAYPQFADQIPNADSDGDDSDGDGRTNGAELGDPDCIWISGGPEPELPALSHPGIVDEPQEVPPATSCSGYVEPNETIENDIGFSTPTSIDETRTHYICEQMEQAVPSSEVLHKIKSSILLDNEQVLHHTFVFFCFNESQDGNRVGEGPYECGGNESRCVRVAGWAVGPEESCSPTHIGEEYDFTGMDKVVVKVEAQYDNSSGKVHQDQSGIRITITPELRPLTAASTVLAEATSNLPHPIYVYSFAPHMHLFGHALYTDHFRCGVKIGEIGRINAYEFDNQQQYVLPAPVKVLPGDTLVTTCEFNTMPSNVSLVGGEETTDEMCLNFLRYYPAIDAISFQACTSFERGIEVERLQSSGVVDFSSSPQASLLSNLRFALGAGNGADTLVLNFESDPTKSLAQCCETDSCEEEYMETLGGVCASDRDCKDDLACLDGFCLELQAPFNGEDTSSNGGLTGEDVKLTSAGKLFAFVSPVVGILAANTFYLSLDIKLVFILFRCSFQKGSGRARYKYQDYT